MWARSCRQLQNLITAFNECQQTASRWEWFHPEGAMKKPWKDNYVIGWTQQLREIIECAINFELFGNCWNLRSKQSVLLLLIIMTWLIPTHDMLLTSRKNATQASVCNVLCDTFLFCRRRYDKYGGHGILTRFSSCCWRSFTFRIDVVGISVFYPNFCF